MPKGHFIGRLQVFHQHRIGSLEYMLVNELFSLLRLRHQGVERRS